MTPLYTLRTVMSRSVLFSSLVQVASLFKVSFMVGSQMAFFSVVNITMPLVGAFGGVTTSLMVVLLGCLVHGSVALTLTSGYIISYLLYHIPGLFASAYWAHNHWTIRVLVPLTCMVLFIAHPVGYLATPYTFYWFIPVFLFLRNSTSVFAQAVGSTFTAHAVGSVIWMYTVPMTVEQWYSLIPLVAIERLLFASGMVVAYKALSLVVQQTTVQNTVPTLRYEAQQ